MWRFLIVLTVAIAAGCADTPGREDSAESECPAWKIEVEDDGVIYCVDKDEWERRDVWEEQDRDWDHDDDVRKGARDDGKDAENNRSQKWPPNERS